MGASNSSFAEANRTWGEPMDFPLVSFAIPESLEACKKQRKTLYSRLRQAHRKIQRRQRRVEGRTWNNNDEDLPGIPACDAMIGIYFQGLMQLIWEFINCNWVKTAFAQTEDAPKVCRVDRVIARSGGGGGKGRGEEMDDSGYDAKNSELEKKGLSLVGQE